MAKLDIPSPKATTFQYPHAIEHEGHLFIAFSNKKNITELLKVSLDDVDRLRRGDGGSPLGNAGKKQ
jgi:hypothetical protein